jgi:hypothetical protein
MDGLFIFSADYSFRHSRKNKGLRQTDKLTPAPIPNFKTSQANTYHILLSAPFYQNIPPASRGDFANTAPFAVKRRFLITEYGLRRLHVRDDLNAEGAPAFTGAAL